AKGPVATAEIKREDTVENHDGARISSEGSNEPGQKPPGGRAEREGRRDGLQVLNADIAPEPAVEPERMEQQKLERQQGWRGLQEEVELAIRDLPIEADEECQVVGRDEQGALSDRGDRIAVRRHRVEEAVERLPGISDRRERRKDQPQIVQEGAPVDV